MPLPRPNLDDRSFDQLVDEARRRIPIYNRMWTDHNVHDPGITFIELFAWLAEIQLYRLNQVGDKNILKFLKLLQVPPEPEKPARVDVTFTSSEPMIISGNTRVVSVNPLTEEEIVFETEDEIEVLPIKVEKLISYVKYRYEDVTSFNMVNNHYFYPFGEQPEVNWHFYIGLDSTKGNSDFESDGVCGKELKINIYFSEPELPYRGLYTSESYKVYPSAEVSWEYWNGEKWSGLVLDTAVKDTVATFLESGFISFGIPKDMQKGEIPSFKDKIYWIRARVTKSGYEIPPRVDRILLNTVTAVQAITIRDEEPIISSGLPCQSYNISYVPVLLDSVTLSVNDEPWQLKSDFDATGPEDNCYILDHQKGQFTFGDGINGRVPPEGAKITINYRYSSLELGNIGAGTISKAITNKRIDSITNYYAASGGLKEETIPGAILRARNELRTVTRAITADDFGFIAVKTPGIKVARAEAIVTGENEVTVVVVPESLTGNITPSDGFIKTVSEHLDKHRLITTVVKVVKPNYIPISINTTIKIKAGAKSNTVSKQVVDSLKKFLSPITGGPDGTGWPFGRNVYQSEIYSIIDDTDGVDGVAQLTISGVYAEFKTNDVAYLDRCTVEIIEPEAVCKES